MSRRASMYKPGDRVVVRSDIQQGIQFGTFHYPNKDYIPGEEFTIKEFSSRGSEYLMRERDVKLYDDMIDHKKSKELTNYRFNKGDIVVCTSKDMTSWIEEGEIVELGGQYWEENNKDERERIDKKREINAISKKSPNGNGQEGVDLFREATSEEVSYFKANGLGSNIMELKKLKKFPTSGWCPDPSKEVKKYVIKNFNQGKLLKTGENGLAWSGSSVWKIKGYSNRPKYSNEQLEKLLPEKKVFIADLETSSLLQSTSDFIVPVYPGKEKHGKSGIQQLMEEKYKEIKLRDYQHEILTRGMGHDYVTSSIMAMQSIGKAKRKKEDEFSQQEAVILKSKKKKRKLIIS